MHFIYVALGPRWKTKYFNVILLYSFFLKIDYYIFNDKIVYVLEVPISCVFKNGVKVRVNKIHG